MRKKEDATTKQRKEEDAKADAEAKAEEAEDAKAEMEKLLNNPNGLMLAENEYSKDLEDSLKRIYAIVNVSLNKKFEEDGKYGRRIKLTYDNSYFDSSYLDIALDQAAEAMKMYFVDKYNDTRKPYYQMKGIFSEDEKIILREIEFLNDRSRNKSFISFVKKIDFKCQTLRSAAAGINYSQTNE